MKLKKKDEKEKPKKYIHSEKPTRKRKKPKVLEKSKDQLMIKKPINNNLSNMLREHCLEEGFEDVSLGTSDSKEQWDNDD